MLYRQGQGETLRWMIGTLRPLAAGERWRAARPARPATAARSRSRRLIWKCKIDPRLEWRQMYREAWRIQRDFLYDPGFHGVNLAGHDGRSTSASCRRRSPRSDLNYLFQEMLGELAVGHLSAGGGDQPEVQDRRDAACSARTTRSPTAATASRGSTAARTGTRRCGAADPAGRQRQGGRVPARGRRPRRRRRRTTSTASSRARPASRCASRSAQRRRRRRARGRRRAGAIESRACAPSPGSRTTAARWTR